MDIEAKYTGKFKPSQKIEIFSDRYLGFGNFIKNMRKRVVVKLLGDAKEAYLKLKENVEKERAKDITSSVHQTLLRSINDKINILKDSYDYGTQIPRKFVARKYQLDYEVTNLWKVDLAGYWRMIYTLRQPQREYSEVEVLEIWLDVLDIVDHKEYNKIFGYKER